ncbi:hypothetical protein PSACC_03063 [Paramicrosporidium saccamoebae]|uniref:Fucosyltransferase n=1 Tax=Paramicrosporidium saccamoebae TaxID=1246581 RepID=A0A2H9TH60_9FUNG|nr:hypothetical protein PSACC_03063 [Paramicrosporidium saccamoebae]
MVGNGKLQAAMQRYEKIHSIGANGEMLAAEMYRYVEDDNVIDHRYIIYTPVSSTCGLGNRLLSLLSTYLLALLTDRTLIVHFSDYDIDTLFCNPFPKSKWSMPDTIKWGKIRSTMYNEPQPAVEVTSKMLRKMVRLVLSQSSKQSTVQLLACGGDLMERWKNVQILHISGNHYFLPLLFANPTYTKILQGWFPDGNVASTLFSYLFHPRDYIIDEVSQTLKDSHHFYRIGLQARYFYGLVKLASANTAIHCLDVLKPEHVFVASLHCEVSEYLANNRLWNITHRYSEGKQLTGRKQASEAVHDIWMLAVCDDLVVTKRSTLGYVATALSKKLPMFLSGPNEEGACSRAISHEPCFHRKMPFESDFCDAFPDASYRLFPNPNIFMTCEDTIGVKLRVKY